MWNVFNVVMRIISSLLGLLLVAVGGIWVLQGLNIAFLVGFMAGDWHWAVYGAALAAVGLAQIAWSNLRQKRG